MKTYTNYNVYNYRKYNKTIENEQWVYIYIFWVMLYFLITKKCLEPCTCKVSKPSTGE